MLGIREIVMRGPGTEDAAVSFVAGANVLAGESDSGKSLLLHCLDYIFGAEEMRKRIPQTEAYSQLFVEFRNTRGQTLTLERNLSGGDLAAHDCPIGEIASPGRKVASRRYGTSAVDDVTSVIFPFAGIRDAQLRKNDRGEMQRLTVRTFMSLFLIDENSVIAEQSPVLGGGGFDNTANKRMFAFMLSGKDDAGVIAEERRDIVLARMGARLSVITDLLAPLEQRLAARPAEDAEDSIGKVEAAIAATSADLAAAEEERTAIQEERRQASGAVQAAEMQVSAIDQLLIRYDLLDQRYGSDLERLDFVSEGAHYFDGLQEVTCPLCDQLMSPDHADAAEMRITGIYEAARAEAAKILAQRVDLAAAVDTLKERRLLHVRTRDEASFTVDRTDELLSRLLEPKLKGAAAKLEGLVARRVELESIRNDTDQAAGLRLMREEIEQASKSGRGRTREWEPLPSAALREFCAEIEAVLAVWGWKGSPRVEFDRKAYDIVVDGQARQSHGKGVRALLYSAFAIALLRYCAAKGRPHPGTVVIDSPLTSYKKGKAGGSSDGPVDAGLEAGFWNSLASVDPSIQIVVLENKEPPPAVASAVHYEWFAGENAGPGERAGFVPLA